MAYIGSSVFYSTCSYSKHKYINENCKAVPSARASYGAWQLVRGVPGNLLCMLSPGNLGVVSPRISCLEFGRYAWLSMC